MCETRRDWFTGLILFGTITVICLSVVIFGTSAQSLSGLKAQFCAPSQREAAADDGAPLLRARANAPMVDLDGNAQPVPEKVDAADRVKGKVMLFVVYTLLTFLVVLFMAFVPIKSAGRPRDMALVQSVCDSY